MPNISLTAFLKILTKGTPQKIQEYGRYLKPGGYDYYRLLKEAVHSITVGGELYSDCAKYIDDVPREPEREYNLDGLKNFEKWKKKYAPSEFFTAPIGVASTPAQHLGIKLEPEFGAVIAGQKRLVHIWYSKNISLTKNAIALGNHLVQMNLCIGDYADCKAAILDLRRKELMVNVAGEVAMDIMISSEFAWIDNFFKSQKQQQVAAMLG